MKYGWVLSLVLMVLPQLAQSAISLNAQDPNKALLVSVSHGLPGLDIDIESTKAMLTHSSNQFQSASLKDVVVADTAYNLEKVAKTAGDAGSFAFYYTGHGLKGGLMLQDKVMTIAEIRGAIEKGRAGQPPLSRLVLIFDSCHSGSLIDPLRRQRYASSREMADDIVREMTAPSRDGSSYAAYWKELFVFASAGADETCLAGEDGSMFTIAMKKAWDTVMKADGTVGDFIAMTKKDTIGSHPVERLVPASIASTKLGR